jgi:lipoate-protein ligase B
MHCVPYSQYLNFLKQKNQLENILIIKHDSCITLGKNSHEREILNKTNLPIYKSNRAGGATYHDQGQLVLYPYINIKKNYNCSNIFYF